MKTLALTSSLGTLLLGTSLVLAQAPADEHAGHHPEGTKPPVTVAPQPGKGSEPAAMPRMQDNMKKMQDLMAKIRASKNPVERQQLLQQHSTAMQNQMKMMRGMGEMMSGGMNMGGATPPAKSPSGTTKSEGMMNNEMMDHQAMHAQMNMMQLMMEQMLQHQDAQQGSAPVK